MPISEKRYCMINDHFTFTFILKYTAESERLCLWIPTCCQSWWERILHWWWNYRCRLSSWGSQLALTVAKSIIARLLLCKWNLSEPEVLRQIDPDVLDIPICSHYCWSWVTIHKNLRDRMECKSRPLSPLSSSLATHWHFKDLWHAWMVLPLCNQSQDTFATIVEGKGRLGWHSATVHSWCCLQWRTELSLIKKFLAVTSISQHVSLPRNCSNASEVAYAGVVYLRLTDSDGNIHTPLVASKTKVAPIKMFDNPTTWIVWSTFSLSTFASLQDSIQLNL